MILLLSIETLMKIKRELPQFEKQNALIIATGKQEAVIYIAFRGIIEKLSEIKIPKPKYSDREGFFARSGKGKSLGSGSVYEDKDEEVKKRFLSKLAEEISSHTKKRKVAVIFAFTPAYMAKKLPEALPKPISQTISQIIRGNFHSAHPFILLSKISKKKIDQNS